jgi:hypothetical protein
MASKEEIIAKTNAARESRKLARDQENAAIRLQRSTRGWLTRIRLSREIREKLDNLLVDSQNLNSIELFKVVRNYLTFGPEKLGSGELERMEKLARILVLSLDQNNPKKSYVGVALNKDHALAWISHMKTLLGKH